MVGEDGTTYTYRCTKCGIKPVCTYSGGLELGDLTFCLDEYKKGSADWKQIDITKGVV
jgi:hypothetical protein